MSAVLRNVVQLWARCLNAAWPEPPSGHARSDFLFVQPSPLHGIARLVDLSGAYDMYNMSRTPGHADANALFADIVVIGQDGFFAVEEEARALTAAQIQLPFAVTPRNRAGAQAQ